MGGTEVHVELGSTLNLTCVVRNTREKPHYLLWYHSNQVTSKLLVSYWPRSGEMLSSDWSKSVSKIPICEYEGLKVKCSNDSGLYFV